MNEYDSEQLRNLLQTHGWQPVDQPEQAELLLINSCAIREKASAKMFDQLGRWKGFKHRNPQVMIGIGGCVASLEGEQLLKRVPYLDLVFGPQSLHRLPDMIRERRTSGKPVVDTRFPAMEKFDALPPPRVAGPYALISIMEGCSKYCSFCVVPYTRGEEVSRPRDEILAEAVHLADQGIRELTLLGQNVNAWRGIKHCGGHGSLAELLMDLATIDGIRRLRFTTSHPLDFGEDLVAAFATVPKVADHLHLPVQSGSDRILAAMKRGYTRLEYKSIVRALRKVRPNLSLSSDFIVGFPGETEEDFAATCSLVEEVGFDQSFSFLYSHRPGTPAATLPNPVPAREGKRRLAILQQLLQEGAQRIKQGMIGRTEQVLVTGPSPKNPGQLRGRASNHHWVHFPAAGIQVGDFVNIRIEQALPHLKGKPC